MPRYRLIDHTADLGLYLYGSSPEEVFINAAAVLVELILNRKPPGPGSFDTLDLAGRDYEDLLVSLISELLYIFYARWKVPVGLKIQRLAADRLKAELETVPFRPEKHKIQMEIKAATYHQIEFKPYKQGWRARIIFDI